jgi:uncharacterized phage protein gp47/JayE
MADVLDPHFIVTEEDVRERMFSNIESIWPDPNHRPDFREGSLVWSMTAPAAKEVVNLYLDLNEALNLSFLQYTYGVYLDAKGIEIGLPRIQATSGRGFVRFLGEDGTIIPAGTTVSTTAEDTTDVAYQIDTDTYEDDGVTVIPAANRTIRGVPDPVARDAVQEIRLDPLPTGGSFRLEFNGDITTPINFNDTAVDVRLALEALPSIGANNVAVSGGPFPFSTVVVRFKNVLGTQPVPLMTLDSVFGGFDGAVVIEEVVAGTSGQASVSHVVTGTDNITGDCIWKYTWVTVLGDEREPVFQKGYGETAGSPATEPVYTLSGDRAELTVAAVPQFTGLQEITKVRLYRSFNDGGGFSDFKYVAEADVPVIPGPVTITDNVLNIDFEVESRTLEDTNATGVVDIPSTALETGANTNIPAGAVALLDDAVFGVAEVTNPLPFSTGDDIETDDDYRARLLEEVRKPPGAGNVADYIGWAKSIAGVGGVTVVPEWEEQFGYPNGPGTVKIVLSGPNNEVVNYELIEDVRSYIAGAIALPAPRDFIIGAYPWSLTVNAGGGIGAQPYTISEETVGTLLQNEVQRLNSNDSVKSGTFALGFTGPDAAPIPEETTGAIAFDATAADIQTALEALPSLAPGDVVVTGGPINLADVSIEFTGTYALTNMENLVVYSNLLVSGLDANADLAGYEYVFTFVNVGGGETPHSAALEDLSEDGAVILTSGPVSDGDTITLHDVPAGPTGTDVENTVKRRIYRRNATSTDDHFYQVGQILGNVVSDFTDTLSDSQVGLRYAPVVNSTSLFTGVAPIGAHITVESISEFAVSVSATIIPMPGYNLLGTGGNINLGRLIRASLDDYFDSLLAGQKVYYTDVQNAINDTAGVLDFRDVVLETYSGNTTDNIIPPNPNAKPVFITTGVLTEAAV